MNQKIEVTDEQERIDKLLEIQNITESLIQGIRGRLKSVIFKCDNCGELIEKEQDGKRMVSPYKCPECEEKKFRVEKKKFVGK